MNKIMAYTSQYENEVKEIFYLSSSIKSFRSDEHKEQFFMNWCGDFIKNYPENFYVMINTENNKLLGYLSGCLNSMDAISCLRVPKYEIFRDQFLKYPAHFHINFHPDTRGLGLGSQLVNFYCEVCKIRKITGVHLITSTDARNLTFYKKLGFVDSIARQIGSSELLFLGKIID